MGQVTYKDLYSLVKREINKTTSYTRVPRYSDQMSLAGTVTMERETFSDVSVAELIQALQEVLNESIPDTILEGLNVEQTTPISANVIVHAGKGSTGGRIYELDEDTTITIPFNDYTRTFFVNLYSNRILIDQAPHPEKLTVAKIIVPMPGATNLIINTKDNSWNAYIVNQKEYRLFGDANGMFEEETVELLRNNMNPLLAETLFGQITISESLKIENSAGTLSLDSDKVLIKDFDGNILAKFNPFGLFFYNAHGSQLAKFGIDEARIGNIRITANTIESGNFTAGSLGFQLRDSGDVEFNNLTVRGTVYATGGEIGGWTIAADNLYATTTGTIKTSATAGLGANGVVLDKDGIRVYDDILGLVVNLPSDGSAPTFSSGVITSVIWNLNTSSVIRTSDTVGDGTVNSAGILINNTGIYGCSANQVFSDANFKILNDGTAYFKGEIQATSGTIGGVTISGDTLIGGTIIGATLRGAVIENSDTMPRVRIDAQGIYYQVTSNVGKYGEITYDGESSGVAPHYGAGVLAYLFNEDYPVMSILAEQNLADIRLYNRGADPVSGTHALGDLIYVNNRLRRAKSAGTPGVFTDLVSIEPRTSDPDSPYDGQIWLRTDYGAGYGF